MEESLGVKKELLGVSLQTKRLLCDQASSPKVSGTDSVELLKISVAKFDSNIFNWRLFGTSLSPLYIHNREKLPQAKELVYLQDPVKNGPARLETERLSQSSETCSEDIICLQKHYDRPHLLQKEQVCLIVETASLRNGS